MPTPLYGTVRANPNASDILHYAISGLFIGVSLAIRKEFVLVILGGRDTTYTSRLNGIRPFPILYRTKAS
jgi:hypothetical protein